jgi:hypothetical protein
MAGWVRWDLAGEVGDGELRSGALWSGTVGCVGFRSGCVGPGKSSPGLAGEVGDGELRSGTVKRVGFWHVMSRPGLAGTVRCVEVRCG